MLISDVITYVNELAPNPYQNTTKLDWINHVEGSIWNEIYKFTTFADISRVLLQAAYDLPIGISFSDIVRVFVEGEELFLIDYKDFNTTGFYRTSTGKLGIYPVPTANDVVASLRVVYKIPFPKFTVMGDTLSVKEPYSKLYSQYLFAMIDWFNKEYDNYNNAIAMFNASFAEFADWYNSGRR